ncbi:filamin-A-interacting protein 1-like isoform X2 [Synchiropus splendidus]|nr:filamin-A-interacting protein 1-like isoform X2 [Synchiropus splendidus]XP_053736555.1 filamin-A-interacting protein 1-like isoform X2 [Synchiropus splendidus]XP_053736556.1 filamin-A-interacting protein 1-like isoform X2 [Synchiropus splendidus]
MRSRSGPDPEAPGDGLEPDFPGEKTQVQRKTRDPLDLSRKDLLQLLGIMEGEVQAREDIIGLLKSQRSGPALLEAQYGSAAPCRPLQALQRDGQFTCRRTREDVYQKPMMQLQLLEDKQKETYRRMLEQLLLAEKCHRRTVMELDSEKRKHVDFMNKSDDFTDLLEQERERLKRLLELEKTYQARKDKEHSRRLDRVRAELLQLKSLALMLVDERQTHLEQMEQQVQRVRELSQKLQDREQRLAAMEGASEEGGRKMLKLEAELEQKRSQLMQEQAEMSAKLAEQESSGRQLSLRLSAQAKKVEELEEHNKALQRSEEDLQELREKISRGQCGNASLMAELESLRMRVLEMEGKDEEISKTESQCRELGTKLQDEENHSRELRLEVDKLQKRMVDLEKLELAFNRSKTECWQVQTNLETEKQTVRNLTSELDVVKGRVKELELAEKKFETTELVLKDDLMRLKSLTVILVDERKNLAERLKQEEERSSELGTKFKAEQNKVTEVTEKLIEESKKLLKLKSEMEVQVTNLSHAKEELKTELAAKEDRCSELSGMLSSLQEKMRKMEEAERRWHSENAERALEEGPKVRELSQEIERLKSRLEQLEVVEGDLMKTEDEYDLLEKRFRSEQDRASVLSKLLEDTRSQLVWSKKVERGEATSLEAELRHRCKTEEARSRGLQADVQALKEKIHELMNKEDQLSQLQVDFSVLQQKCLAEEGTSRRLSQEVHHLSKELEATKRYSRVMRPGTNGSRMVDVPVTSTAVQTDMAAGNDEDSTAGFIRQSVQEENRFMNNLRHQDLMRPSVLDRYPAASADGPTRQPWTPWSSWKEDSAPEMFRRPGKPLHIRVTPHHANSTATLEITSPRGEDFFSSTTIIPTLGHQTPRITIVPKATSVSSKIPDPPGHLTRVNSPVTITTISRAKSPVKKSGSRTELLQSPVSIITVSTTPVSEVCESPDPHQNPAGRTVIKMTPERQSAARPGRTCSSSSSIVTTEDNKIHIHLGPQMKTSGHPAPLQPLSPETSPSSAQIPSLKTALAKMKSSIMITPVSSAASRPGPPVVSTFTDSLTAPDPSALKRCCPCLGPQLAPDARPSRSGATQMPLAWSLKPGGVTKAVLGVSTLTRVEARTEGQSMKIELKSPTLLGQVGKT